ncbi:UPF0182 family protein [Isoptericola sp. b441]|uniref:UPF0182 protein Q6348_14015 n=1 Tax=Actinotalea lenta TaxID=3064654 RepID=A0ABT9DEX6_9CELL|nr:MULTISPECIES: UPF0182 family protein [unclassified Isoptericola]MDO8108311.1 UPF0182 family protein [Isoptericola sp. b441]MDO8122676.1 UPF0182 family protein [Isoptericola sp. b490]
MTFARPSRPSSGSGGPRRKRGPLGPTIAIIIGLVVLVMIMAQVWTEVLWFRQVGYLGVLTTQWITRAILFVAGFVVMGVAVWASLAVAYRSRPVYAPSTPEQASLDQYREMIEPLRRLVMIAGPAVVGFFAGSAASAQWQDVLLFLNRTSFGTTDPQFGLDVSFYLFVLPMLRFVVSFLLAVAVVAGIAGLATHYLYGGLRVGGGSGPRTIPAARVQLGVTAAVIIALIGVNYWLDRYSLLTKTSADATVPGGASYTDVNAVMPAKAILTGVAALIAIVFLYAAFRGTWRVPVIGVGLMVISAILVGGIYPAVVQRFQVQPNQQSAESEYIQRNIDATKAAFGLSDAEITPYDAKLTATAGALRSDAETTASIRLLDPAIVSPSFRQLQQNKQYYDFPKTLSVDRYNIDGESRDTVIAVRELNLGGLDSAQRTWVNDHTVFTHGFGVVAAYGNTTAADGRPSFYEGGIPPVGALGKYEPRIYFGENLPDYSIVGAPAGTSPWELDYPDDSAGGQVNTTFPTAEVKAGPSIGNLWNKLLYSLKFGSEQILFSNRVTPDSQILYDRSPQDRVKKVAPYLTLDSSVYPAVVDGRVVWIVDGYTTSDQYPYSTSKQLEQVTQDSLTARGGALSALAPDEVNYLRNSIKATVDAYSGKVTLYSWEPTDPVLETWQKIFPNTVKPMSDISGALMSHLRYPQDLFKVQRDLMAHYHVGTASEFYSGQDFWRNPEDPVNSSELQPPYYLTLKMPSQDNPTFSLTSVFIPGGNTDRQVLTGFMAVDAEPGDTAGQRRADYGKIRILELPRNSTVPGPGQVQNAFNSDPNVSESLNVLRLGSSTVVSGNLLTLPVGGGLLYVQPVYVQSSAGTKFPLLQRVLVAFGENIGFSDTLGGALDQVFGGDAGVDTPGPTDSGVPNAPTNGGSTGGSTSSPTTSPTTSPSSSPTTSPTTPPAGDAQAALNDALQRAKQALDDGQAALTRGDFAAYGEAQKRLQAALTDAITAEAQLNNGG